MEPELPLEPELPPEPEPLLEPELPVFWNTTVPVVVGLVPCGAKVVLFPETQYEYWAPFWVVTTLLEVVYVPSVDGLTESKPIVPVC